MNQKHKILEKAKELFFRLGVRSITMDDLARELGVSKKTLYKYFDNKSDLVNAVLIQHFDTEKKLVENVLQNADNAIDEIIMIAKNGLKHFRKLHPSSIYDLKKYYPKAWAIVEQFKTEFLFQSITSNLERGIKQGYYRENLQANIIAKLYANNIDFLVNPNAFPATEYNFAELYKEFLVYHLHGIVTEKGFNYLKNHELEENE